MEWAVTSSELNSTFSSLGTRNGDVFEPNLDCKDHLERILHRILTEDCVLRTYRRAIGLSQGVKKDIIPLMCNIQDKDVFDLIIKVLCNLTIPVECLMDIDVSLRTDHGRSVIFDLNWLLTSCKEAFIDSRTTRCLLDFIKSLLDKEEEIKKNDCEIINNCLLLLRNVLHIPEVRGGVQDRTGTSHQNQLIWNMFTQSFDKILIQLMTGSHRAVWGTAVVQLIALVYKDQHVSIMQKLLSLWFEASLSESSEDNESNTSPPDQGSGDSSSSMMTSDPTSDSSDNGGSSERDLNHSPMSGSGSGSSEGGDRDSGMSSMAARNSASSGSSANSANGNSPSPSCSNASKQNHNHNVNWMSEMGRKNFSMNRKHFINVKSQGKKEKNDSSERSNHCDSKTHTSTRSWSNSNDGPGSSSGNSAPPSKKGCNSELSDCGYGTQLENQGSISTSSNEDESPNTNSKPVHQKPTNMIHKARYHVGKIVMLHEKKEWRRKKLIKRSKANSMNMKALLHHTPSDEDITHLLKEFTVDFLLKGYSCLVHELQLQLLTSLHAQIDTSHFFWLITYFLKFASQLELDLEHVSPVLSYETVSYLTFEGVNLCEQLEISKQQPEANLSPFIRRIHLVVTALREVLQTVETYKKFSHLEEQDEDEIKHLQEQISSTEELKYLFLLLLRYFDPTLQSKQYLQDVIVTNHNLLIFLEKCNRPANRRSSISDHIKQRTSVNKCIFLQDWSDLIEYVVHKFVNLPVPQPADHKKLKQGESLSSGWSKDDSKNLHKYYVKSACSSDPIGRVLNCFTESGVLNKTRIGVIEQLLKQDVISDLEFDEFIKKEPDFDTLSQSSKVNKNNSNNIPSKSANESLNEIKVLRDHLINENKENCVMWLKRCLLDACHAKLSMTHKMRNVEPVPYHYALLQQSIPLVPWTREQNNVLQYQPFVLLLSKLGLHLPSDSGKIFVRIPNFWTSDIMYSTAQKLGPMNADDLKFDPQLLQESNSPGFDLHSEATAQDGPSTPYQMKQTQSFFGFTPKPDLKSNWMEIVKSSKSTASQNLEPANLETETVSACSESDLSHMCVSDEDIPVSSADPHLSSKFSFS
ncbi:protein timeless [Nilaparvata lugens]|uniref:protein timeless n=1 Tax=Nilaparvata lugens TaxID=108931 RepID=UPI00193E079C|nr:protein timeless [Nilaparvata lugens]